jgi:hypothetical protein
MFETHIHYYTPTFPTFKNMTIPYYFVKKSTLDTILSHVNTPSLSTISFNGVISAMYSTGTFTHFRFIDTMKYKNNVL